MSTNAKNFIEVFKPLQIFSTGLVHHCPEAGQTVLISAGFSLGIPSVGSAPPRRTANRSPHSNCYKLQIPLSCKVCLRFHIRELTNKNKHVFKRTHMCLCSYLCAVSISVFKSVFFCRIDIWFG